MTEIEEELIATLADVRRARNEAADLVVRTARERDAALARAEAAEAERDAHCEALTIALARIAAIEDLMHRADSGEYTDDEYDADVPLLCEAIRAALAEPVEPPPSACANPECKNGLVPIGPKGMGGALVTGPTLVPCPSCTPPDPVP